MSDTDHSQTSNQAGGGQNLPAQVVGASFALSAFAVAVLAGLAGGNDATSILTRALIAMIICYPVGLVSGLICHHVVRQHLDEIRPSPVTQSSTVSSGSSNSTELSAENGVEAGEEEEIIEV